MSTVKKIAAFLKLSFPDKLNRVYGFFCQLKGVLYYRHIFGSFGSGSKLFKPLLISNSRFVHIGRNVLIRQGARIEVIVSNGRIPVLHIGDNVNIEQNVHILCHSRIEIGSNVSITGHCAIVDVTHPYVDVQDSMKIGDRILNEDSFVEIGDGSFLGFGAFIMPNVRIGRYCIVGAHSLVTKSIPDYTVVAGNPASVLQHYDIKNNAWKRVDRQVNHQHDDNS